MRFRTNGSRAEMLAFTSESDIDKQRAILAEMRCTDYREALHLRLLRPRGTARAERRGTRWKTRHSKNMPRSISSAPGS